MRGMVSVVTSSKTSSPFRLGQSCFFESDILAWSIINSIHCLIRGFRLQLVSETFDFEKNDRHAFDSSIQRKYFKTFMQKVQETEASNQDLDILETSRQSSTISRVTERLALLKHVFVQTRTPRQAGLVDPPYRKKPFHEKT